MSHTIHNLQQGTPDWHAYRQTHFNASEAAAMLGISSYQTRSDLLKFKATGIAPEIDAQTQSRFDAGHAAEAAARPFAEKVIGSDLYPITASRDVLVGSTLLPLSASYDGTTMGEDIVWEHKLLNAMLTACLGNGIIPEQYHPQLEQQLMVIGAEKALFMATNGDEESDLYAWYTSNPELRQRLLDGWTQFAADLAAYQHTPQAAPAPIGRTPETLPALHIEVTGMVTASNLAAFKGHALAVFAEINRDLVTDQDFASAEATVKWCGEVEQRLAAAKQHALSQTESIDALFRTIDEISAEARSTRLELDKLVKNRKDSIRADIVADGRNALAAHLDGLAVRIGGRYMPSIAADFAGAIKGKRTLDSMRDAVATELARAKIEANATADRITVNLRTLNEKPELAFLFADVYALVLKAPDDLAAVVQNRIMAHEAKEAERRAAETARIAEQERIKAEAKAQADMAIAQAAAPVAAPQAVTPPQVVVQAAMAIVDAQRPEAPTLKLGQISARLGFTVSGDFLGGLGFNPAARDKSALLFHESDFPLICDALIRHIEQVQMLQAA